MIAEAIRSIEQGKDDLCSPVWLLDRVRALGPIAFDPCANPWSSVGASVERSKHAGQCGLATPWAFELLASSAPRGSVYVNPPYSNPLPWAEATRDAARAGLECFFLSKLDPSTRWSAILREVATARVDFYRRITFEGGAHKTGMFASTLVYTGRDPVAFVQAFEELGDARRCASRSSAT